ncbi:unnamed protein product [Effrenium voratum]|nr:unnamed protein product [Effrenium voratum]
MSIRALRSLLTLAPLALAPLCFVNLSPRARPEPLRAARRAEETALAPVEAPSSAGSSLLLPPLKVASLGMGLLKPIFAAEAKLQALAYDEEAIRAQIAEEVKSAPVVVYTYALSPFCTEAVKLLEELGVEYKEIQLAPEWFLMLGENAAKRAELGELYGRTSMPHVFVNGESIGGLMEGPGLVPLYESGELQSKLQAAGALPSAEVALQMFMAWLTLEWKWPAFLVALYVVGATANHSLFLAIHELAHNLGASTIWGNKLISLVANFPIGIPYAINFKPYHMEHHRYQGQDGVDTDVPSRLEGWVLTDTSTGYVDRTCRKAVFMFFQIFFYALRPTFIKPSLVAADAWMVLNYVVQFSFDGLMVYFFGPQVMLWLVGSTFLAGSIHPTAGHFIAEHYVMEGEAETYSYYGPLNWLTYNVRQMAPEFYENLPQCNSVGTLLKYIFDDSISPYSRVKRAPKKVVSEWQKVQDKYFKGWQPLPAGWLRVISKSTGKVFFVNRLNGTTRLDQPQEPAQSTAGCRRNRTCASAPAAMTSSMTSFGTYEPSDAFLEAMKVRVGVKAHAARGLAEDREEDAPPKAPEGGVSVPKFRLNGGLRDSVPLEYQNLPPAAVPVAETGGISFAMREASHAYAPPETESREQGSAPVFEAAPAQGEKPGLKSLARSEARSKPSLGQKMRRQAPANLSDIDERWVAESSVRSVASSAKPGAGSQASSRSNRPPSAPSTSRKPSSLQMQEAADEALSRALAQASAGLGLDLTSLEAPSHMEPSTQSLGKLPSAVTVAGEPVASTGDMIYLGGGLYACAAPEKPKKKQASRKPPRRPASVMRSASAHIVGPQTESSELSSPQSRAHSEGQIGFANLYSEHRGPSRAGSVVGSSTTAVGPPPGPRVWRPSGVQKLPAAKLEPPAGFGGKASRLSAEDAGKMPGEHAEERAHCRRSSGKEGVMLFGSNGVLAHMRDPALEQHQAAPPPSGPPKGISKRLEERKAAKQARVEEVLEERALRLATEAAISMQKRQNLAARAKHASAPDLSVEELEKQRQRVACKMEILDFFHGYRNAVHKFTEEQQKVLHANLHGSGLHEASLLRVCMLGSSAIATETLKNLVLPGVGHFTVVDGSIVEPADLGQNFFLEEADLGKLRSEAVCRWLLEMNPDVQGTHLDLDPAKAVAQGKEFFRQFTMVIACQMMECLAIQLGKVCEEIGIPLVLATSVGFVGKLRIYASEHCVCETKPDSEFGDLRLNDPFPELRRFADSIDFATLNDSEHAHVPYVVILIRALDTWRSRGEARKLPKTSAEKDEFKAIVSKMRRSPQEANFEEAMANAYKAWMPYVIPDSVQEVLSLVSHAGKSDFWILARAVSQFVRDCGKLPLAGSLPDMTAASPDACATDWYIKLQDESHRNSESM